MVGHRPFFHSFFPPLSPNNLVYAVLYKPKWRMPKGCPPIF
jgi:hypothetical protein